jgi:hypothetical protein
MSVYMHAESCVLTIKIRFSHASAGLVAGMGQNSESPACKRRFPAKFSHDNLMPQWLLWEDLESESRCYHRGRVALPL